MLTFSNCKINIGLNIVSKRDDGFHNIESVFYPLPLFDIVEIVKNDSFELINFGLKIDCPPEKNLCYKAFEIIREKYQISPVKIILSKKIPFGSGLGAGSANAAFTLKLLNEFFVLNITDGELENYASKIGADCAFFIRNKPVFATEKGNVFENIDLDLSNYVIDVAFSDISVNTKDAYQNCNPHIPQKRIKEVIKLPITEWKNYLENDFENNIFRKYPQLSEIKQNMYDKGAIYAQMSGSGSAIFGIFEKK